MKWDPASFLFSSTGDVGFITEVIQISEIVATVSLLLPGNLLHMELILLITGLTISADLHFLALKS